VSDSFIFKDLPATFPGKNKYRKPSVIGGIIFHVVLIGILILIPLLLPEKISQRHLLVALIAPPPPPPAAPPRPPVPVNPVTPPKVVKPPVHPVAPDAMILPTVVPKDLARIIDEPVGPPAEVVGALPGGLPGGVAGGVLGNVLSATGNGNGLLPPPPPPPPKVTVPTGPVRVGGAVREPRIIKVSAPVYPPIASKARVSGTVVMEAILTEDGTVDKIRVISGHPLLVEAAMECLKHWKYEPTLLNGIPVRVMLTAKVNFNRPV